MITFKLTEFEVEAVGGKAWNESLHPRDAGGRFGEGGGGKVAIKKEGAPSITAERLRHERKYYGYEEIVGGGSKGLLVYMSPSTFLSLATDSFGDAKTRALKYGKFDEKKFNQEYLPYLNVDDSGQVTDHEGRARAELLKREGFSSMPVVLASKSRKKSANDFPATLKSEDTSEEYKYKKELLLTV